MSAVSGVGAPQGASQRAFTRESITKLIDHAMKDGDNTYWKIATPHGLLKLRAAPEYVQKRYPNAQGYDRFVYWEPFRVAGPASAIAAAFTQAGIYRPNPANPSELLRDANGNYVPYTAEFIYQNSRDPLRPEVIAAISQKVGPRGPAVKKAPTYTLQQYIHAGNVFRVASGKAALTLEGEKKPAAGTAGAVGGGRSPAANLQKLVQQFSAFMAAAAGGQETKVYNVSEFDSGKLTGARAVAATKSDIRPTINVGGRQVPVPIVVKAGKLVEGAPNFQAFVNQIVKNSQYAQYADAILADFNNRVSRPLAAVPVSAPLTTGFAAAPAMLAPAPSPMLSMQQPAPLPPPTFAAPPTFAPVAPPTFAAAPRLPTPPGGMTLPGQLPPLPSAGAGTPLGAASPSSGSASPRSAGTRSAGGLPITGQTGTLPALPSLGGNFSLPPLPSASPQ